MPLGIEILKAMLSQTREILDVRHLENMKMKLLDKKFERDEVLVSYELL